MSPFSHSPSLDQDVWKVNPCIQNTAMHMMQEEQFLMWWWGLEWCTYERCKAVHFAQSSSRRWWAQKKKKPLSNSKCEKGNKLNEWSVSSTWGSTCRYLNILVIIIGLRMLLLRVYDWCLLRVINPPNNAVVVTSDAFNFGCTNIFIKTILPNRKIPI